jgi:hypothetical protein
MFGFPRFLLVALLPTLGLGFVPLSKTPVRNLPLQAVDSEGNLLPTPTKEVVKKVGVTGATGRTGRFVVEELLERGVEVVAMVRSVEKANEVFPDEPPNLKIMQCDLMNKNDIEKGLDGCDSAIWCATGFSDAPLSIVEKVKQLFGIAIASKSIGKLFLSNLLAIYSLQFLTVRSPFNAFL